VSNKTKEPKQDRQNQLRSPMSEGTVNFNKKYLLNHEIWLRKVHWNEKNPPTLSEQLNIVEAGTQLIPPKVWISFYIVLTIYYRQITNWYKK